MAKGTLNKVILIGNLGNDPVIRMTSKGKPVANLSIATNESWKDQASGERVVRTEWHHVVLFGALAEIAEKYLHKGNKVCAEGQIKTSKWQDNDGIDRYSTEIVASSLEMLGGRDLAEGQGEYSSVSNDEIVHALEEDPIPF